MEKPNKYELLDNETFLYWLMTGEDDQWDIWYQASEDNRLLAEELRSELRSIEPERPPVYDSQKAFLLEKIKNSVQLPKQRIIPLWLRWSAAAAIITVVSLIAITLQGEQKIIAAAGEQAEVTFPDGSKATLNAQSSISYNKYLWWLSPKVRIDGEGYFFGKHTKGFTVKGTDCKVKIIGTRFNIYNRNGNLSISCYEGEVSYRIPKLNNSSHLRGGELVTANIASNKVERGLIDSNKNEPSWVSGNFFYVRTPFNEVLKEVERQFKVSIKDKERFSEYTYTGFFSNNDLDNALTTTLIPMGLSYTQKDSTITLFIKK